MPKPFLAGRPVDSPIGTRVMLSTPAAITTSMLPAITAAPATRALLFAQFCARPWAVDAAVAHDEAKGEAEAPGTDPMLAQMMTAPMQPGLEPGEAPQAPVLIAWGKEDRVTLPVQAPRAQ